MDPAVDITYQQLKASFQKIVILGDPGGGKSTICQNLCYDLAKQANAPVQISGRPLEGQLQRFPFRIILRLFERARAAEPQLTIIEYIVRDLKSHISLEAESIKATLLSLMQCGRAVLAFDGLDEILVSAQRREFVDLVSSFCSQYPLCPVIVTSRLVGYDDAPLPSDFEEIVIDPFTDAQVAEYIRNFMAVVAGKKAEEALAQSRRFLSQTQKNASDLRKNPLMLGLMAWIFNSRGDVPANRPEVYRECAILMFDKWDQDRNIHADVPDDFDRLQLFSHLADKIFEDVDLRAGVSARWLQTEIQTYLSNVYEKRQAAYQTSNKLVKYMCERAWAMTEVGENTYTFTHQTFLEYFFSMHLDDMNDSVRDLFEKLLPKILNREWDVVSHLALQIKTHRRLKRQEEALREFVKALKVNRDTAEQKSLNMFCARALEYLPGPEIDVKAIVTLLVQTAISDIIRGDADAGLNIYHCEQCAHERRPFVRDVIINEICEALKSQNNEAFKASVRLLSPNIFGERTDTGLWTGSLNLSSTITSGIRSRVKNYILSMDEKRPEAMLLQWQWYGIIKTSTLRLHTLAPFYDSMISPRLGVDGLTAILLANYKPFSEYYVDTGVNEASAESAMRTIGQNASVLYDPDPQIPELKGRLSVPPAQFYNGVLTSIKQEADVQLGAITLIVMAVLMRRSKNRRADQSLAKDDLRGIHRMLKSHVARGVLRDSQIAESMLRRIEEEIPARVVRLQA